MHRLIFPPKATSGTVLYEDQNLWILDEGLNYHVCLDSDRPLRQNVQLETDSLLRPDLAMIKAVFKTRYSYVEGDAPYVSIVVVEFKRPGRETYARKDDPIKEVIDQVSAIREGKFRNRGGRMIALTAGDRTPAYAYVVCDKRKDIERFAKEADCMRTPDGQGYYKYHSALALFIQIMT